MNLLGPKRRENQANNWIVLNKVTNPVACGLPLLVEPMREYTFVNYAANNSRITSWMRPNPHLVEAHTATHPHPHPVTQPTPRPVIHHGFPDRSTLKPIPLWPHSSREDVEMPILKCRDLLHFLFTRLILRLLKYSQWNVNIMLKPMAGEIRSLLLCRRFIKPV